MASNCYNYIPSHKCMNIRTSKINRSIKHTSACNQPLGLIRLPGNYPKTKPSGVVKLGIYNVLIFDYSNVK